MPVLVYQLFRFLAPGLTKNESGECTQSAPEGHGLLCAQGLLLRGSVACSALEFLLNFGTPQIEIQPTISGT